MFLLLAIALPMIIALLVPFWNRFFPIVSVSYLTLLTGLLLTSFFLLHIPSIISGKAFVVDYAWIVSLGIGLGLYVDIFSLLASLMLTASTVLIAIYYLFYLKKDKLTVVKNNFYTLLVLSAALGSVISSNIIITYIFVEVICLLLFMLLFYQGEFLLKTQKLWKNFYFYIISGGAILIGFLGFYVIADTFSMIELSKLTYEHHSSSLLVVSLALIFFGLLIKLLMIISSIIHVIKSKEISDKSLYFQTALAAIIVISYLLYRWMPMFIDANYLILQMMSMLLIFFILATLIEVFIMDLLDKKSSQRASLKKDGLFFLMAIIFIVIGIGLLRQDVLLLTNIEVQTVPLYMKLILVSMIISALLMVCISSTKPRQLLFVFVMFYTLLFFIYNYYLALNIVILLVVGNLIIFYFIYKKLLYKITVNHQILPYNRILLAVSLAVVISFSLFATLVYVEKKENKAIISSIEKQCAGGQND